MPSREEIVEWLRIGAKDCTWPEISTGLTVMADEVEAMRCETCRKRYQQFSTAGDLIDCPGLFSGGCFHHEQKPAG